MEDGSQEFAVPLHEYKCSRCARVFISADSPSGQPRRVRCPICRSGSVARLASVFATVDLSAEPPDESKADERADKST